LTNALIEHKLYGHSRVGTGKYSGEWFLLFHGTLLENRKILFVSGQTACHKSLVAIHQLGQCRIRGSGAL
jgi:hypothetical protein